MIVHGSCVALDGRGLLIVGASGTGKSTLALQLMACGARLVADDRVELRVDDTRLIAERPQALPPLIEARHLGLLRADCASSAVLEAVVDLDQTETARLPYLYDATYLDVTIPLFRGVRDISFAPALMQFLRAGRYTP